MKENNIIDINKIEYEIISGSTYTGKEIKALGDINLEYQLWYLGNNGNNALIFNNDILTLNGGESFHVVPIINEC
jgi:hypothetical protein